MNGSSASAAAAVASSAAAQNAGSLTRPNILLIISDQFRWDCIGAMGLNPMNLTPNLDRMASRGCLFRSAISNQPVCAPGARQHLHRPVPQQDTVSGRTPSGLPRTP